MAENVLTEMAGVYSVAAELSLRGHVVAVTSRNAPGVDIIAVSPDLQKTVSIQVKANKPTGTHAFWLLSKRAQTDVAPSLFYVFVNLKDTEQRADFYVVPSKIVARDMVVDERRQSTWYSFGRDQKYRDRWDLLSR
ncbi:MAG: hypothetical protein ACREKF_13800 [Candidatus Methylomirabilales bacterium]